MSRTKRHIMIAPQPALLSAKPLTVITKLHQGVLEDLNHHLPLCSYCVRYNLNRTQGTKTELSTPIPLTYLALSSSNSVLLTMPEPTLKMAGDNNPSSNNDPNRFTHQNSTAEDLLKSQTVGLVQLSDFRKRRAEVLERKEREAQEYYLAKGRRSDLEG